MLKAILGFIEGAQKVSAAVLGPALDFIDQRAVVRRAMVLIVLWQLVDAYLWAKGFAMLPNKSGAELSLVIAAITVPVTALQGFLYKMYDNSRRGEK